MNENKSKFYFLLKIYFKNNVLHRTRTYVVSFLKIHAQQVFIYFPTEFKFQVNKSINNIKKAPVESCAMIPLCTSSLYSGIFCKNILYRVWDTEKVQVVEIRMFNCDLIGNNFYRLL